MNAGALLPATVERSLTRLSRADRQSRLGRMLNPTADRVVARPIGTAAASGDYFDRLGPALMRAVGTLIGNPAFPPTEPGRVDRMPWPPPPGPPPALDHTSPALSAKGASLADQAQKAFEEASAGLRQFGEEGATSQAELLALQQKFMDASRLFNLATNMMKARHDVQKQMIQNLQA